MKKLWKVGYSYYPHEGLVSDEWTVFGTKKEAQTFCLKQLATCPFKSQVDTDFTKDVPRSVYCVEKKVIYL